MSSCHKDGVRYRNRAGIEAPDPALRAESAYQENKREWTSRCRKGGMRLYP
eukprot:gene26060-biopygen13365